MSDQMQGAIRRQMEQRELAHYVDRTGWTRQQWIDDARVLMDHPDGAITSLVNGHVMALLAEVQDAAVMRAGRPAKAEADPCPDCAAGKHQNCTEFAFDENDHEVRCPCMAAGHGTAGDPP